MEDENPNNWLSLSESLSTIRDYAQGVVTLCADSESIVGRACMKNAKLIVELVERIMPRSESDTYSERGMTSHGLGMDRPVPDSDGVGRDRSKQNRVRDEASAEVERGLRVQRAIAQAYAQKAKVRKAYSKGRRRRARR